jgi:hypothetical protein
LAESLAQICRFAREMLGCYKAIAHFSRTTAAWNTGGPTLSTPRAAFSPMYLYAGQIHDRVFQRVPSHGCVEAKVLLELYTEAIAAFHKSQEPILAGILPNHPTYSELRELRERATTQCSKPEGSTGRTYRSTAAGHTLPARKSMSRSTDGADSPFWPRPGIGRLVLA